MTTSTPTESREQEVSGVLYALTAFGIWGISPVYFTAVEAVPSLEVLAHRVVWGMLLLFTILLVKRRAWRVVYELRAARRLRFYLATTLVLSANWLTFIWAVQHQHVLAASLGYYINPLVSVMLGVLFLGERLSAPQVLAVALATGGVLNLVLGYGAVPWISLILAFSFGTYGLLRKKAGVDAMIGLAIETLLLAPVALLYLGVLAERGIGAFGRLGWPMDLLLSLSGPVTALPLLCFLEGARRLRLSTVGLLQYLAPTLQLLLAVLLYHEPFHRSQLITFACIWLALGLYSFDAFFARRGDQKPRAQVKAK